VGADPYRRARDQSVKIIGATAHYATEELDAGPIIEQDVARVSHRLTVEELEQIGRDIELIVLARAVRWHVEDRVLVHENKNRRLLAVSAQPVCGRWWIEERMNWVEVRGGRHCGAGEGHRESQKGGSSACRPHSSRRGRPRPPRSGGFEMRKAGFAVPRLVPVVVVSALLFSALVAGAKANPAPATVSFVGTAELVSDPVPAVDVTLHYSCLSPSPGFLAVNLDEDGLPPIVGGVVGEATCDGKNHSVTVTVDGLFVPGTAAGRAEITNYSGGAMATTTATVFIK
jgi:hypothetical protein